MKYPDSLILPYNFDVETKTYMFDAFYLGINKANNTEGYLADLFNDYGHVMIANSLLNFYTSWRYSPHMFDSYYTDLHIYDFIDISMKDLFVDYIKAVMIKGFYVEGDCDYYYIEGKSNYKRDHFNHGYHLYGYDDNQQCFISSGYYNGQHQSFPISYDSYFDAVTNKYINHVGLRFYKQNQSYFNQKIDVPKIYLLFRAYLESLDIYFREKTVYGVEAVRAIINNEDTSDFLDYRNIRLLAELREINLIKLGYLLDNKYITCTDLVEQYKDISFESRMSFNLAIKNTQYPNNKYKSKIISQLNNQLKNEIKTLKEIMYDFGRTSNLKHLDDIVFNQ